MTAFYSICSWVLDRVVGQIQVRRSAEAERDATPRYETLAYSDKAPVATSGRISASPVTLSRGNSGSLYLVIAKLKMSGYA
jgi:hypothetical protein